MGDPGFFALFLAVGSIGVALVTGPIGQVIARRLGGERRDPTAGLSTGEMAAERVSQLEERVHELEERLDFAERMLAQSTGERPALPEGRTQ